jgi:hypothetical protein
MQTKESELEKHRELVAAVKAEEEMRERVAKDEKAARVKAETQAAEEAKIQAFEKEANEILHAARAKLAQGDTPENVRFPPLPAPVARTTLFFSPSPHLLTHNYTIQYKLHLCGSISASLLIILCEQLFLLIGRPLGGLG